MKNQATNNHIFNVFVADKIGVNGANILQNIAFWLQRNEANEVNFYEGKYWTYNSVRSLTKIFTYLSRYQIEKALKDLEDNGYIVSGNFNKLAYDRTKWYSITEKGYQLFLGKKPSISLQEYPNTITKISQMKEQETWQPIPDINTDINTDVNKDINTIGQNDLFNEFWEEYPRKVNKKKARTTYKRKVDKELHEIIIKDLNKRKRSKQWQEEKFIPHPTTYLNGERWNDEIEKIKDTNEYFVPVL